MTWEAHESAMTVAVYAALGQSVTYVAQDADSSTIYAIVDTNSELIGIAADHAEEVTRVRVKVSDVPTPRRGDRIEMANGDVYVIDGVNKENNVEWSLTLTERDR